VPSLDNASPETRGWIAGTFTVVEGVVYAGLGLLFAGSALVLRAAAGASKKK
jgi:hypothetical protein